MLASCKAPMWVQVHAEANALLNSNLSDTTGASVYVTMFPCNECAKLLIQAGIQHVVYLEVQLPCCMRACMCHVPLIRL